MRAFHLTYSSNLRDPLFPDEALRRRALRVLARVAGDRAVLFCIVDDHLHNVVLCDKARVGRVAEGLRRALSPLAGAQLAPAHIRPVEGRSHMQWLVRYVLNQPSKHGLSTHPALWTGSCFADLIGARCVPGLTLRLADALPRFHWRDACALVGLDPTTVSPASNGEVRTAGAARLVAAAGAAFAVGPELSGKSRGAVTAKRAAVQLGFAAGLARSELAWAVDQPLRSVRRLAASPLDTASLATVRRRIALENAVAFSGQGA